MIHMITNMIIFKSPEYSWLQICNVYDVNVIDWINTCSKIIFQRESNKQCTKTENKKTCHTKTENQN